MSRAPQLGTPEVMGELQLISNYGWTMETVDTPETRSFYRSAPMNAADARRFKQMLIQLDVLFSHQPVPAQGQSRNDPECAVEFQFSPEEAFKALTRWPEHSHVPTVTPDKLLQRLTREWPDLVWLPHEDGYVAKGGQLQRNALQQQLQEQGFAFKHRDIRSVSEAPAGAIFILPEVAATLIPAQAMPAAANRPAQSARTVIANLNAATSLMWSREGESYVARGFSRGRGEAFLSEIDGINARATEHEPIRASLSAPAAKPENDTPPTVTLSATDAERYLAGRKNMLAH
ncbi:MAG: hypothetical protein ACKVOE_02730 [Rickettsiales bacterium]